MYECAVKVSPSKKGGEKTHENAFLVLVTLHVLNLAHSNNKQWIHEVLISRIDVSCCSWGLDIDGLSPSCGVRNQSHGDVSSNANGTVLRRKRRASRHHVLWLNNHFLWLNNHKSG
jgi:hypothetical protein